MDCFIARWASKLPRDVDGLELELSGTITCEGGLNEAITIYRAADSLHLEGGRGRNGCKGLVLTVAENDLDNRIPAGHAVFLNLLHYARFCCSKTSAKGQK